MKKALSLVLALAMCLSLCACGGNKAESAVVPTTNDNPTTNEESTTVEPTEATAIEVEDHPLLPQLCGEWALRIQDDAAAFTSIVIQQDGNCIVDGVEATWKYPNHNTDNLYIEVYNGTEMICAVMLFESAEGMTINGVDTDGWVCPGIYEKIS